MKPIHKPNVLSLGTVMVSLFAVPNVTTRWVQ